MLISMQIFPVFITMQIVRPGAVTYSLGDSLIITSFFFQLSNDGLPQMKKNIAEIMTKIHHNDKNS